MPSGADRSWPLDEPHGRPKLARKLYKLAEPNRAGHGSGGWDLTRGPDAERQKKLILVVEDDFVLRSAIAELLTVDGYDVESAADGLEALIRLDSCPRKPSVILLDITMPRLNGLEAAQLIRNESPESKLVILSQHEPSLMRQAALGAGASAYVTKSEVSRELTTAIESLISSGS